MILQFDRVGRNHHVQPLTVPDGATDDAIADAVIRYVYPMLGSRDVSVAVDLNDQTGAVDGSILCGFRNGGTFRSDPAAVIADGEPEGER